VVESLLRKIVATIVLDNYILESVLPKVVLLYWCIARCTGVLPFSSEIFLNGGIVKNGWLTPLNSNLFFWFYELTARALSFRVR
jgi:hypothetical protein